MIEGLIGKLRALPTVRSVSSKKLLTVLDQAPFGLRLELQITQEEAARGTARRNRKRTSGRMVWYKMWVFIV